MTWIKIDRDEDGFTTRETLNAIVELHKNGVPIVMRSSDAYEIFSPYHDIYGWYAEYSGIERLTDYTHYLPIPKLEV